MKKIGCYKGIISPHPPIIIDKIGDKETKKVKSTIKALNLLSDELEKNNPDTIVIMSPHSTFEYQSFVINDSSHMTGSFQSFGFSELQYSFEGDTVFQSALIDAMKSYDIPYSLASDEIRYSKSSVLDHGILVPLHFLTKKIKPKLAPISISDLSLKDHYIVGKCIFEAAEKTGRNAVFIASGDLSHRLTKIAPAGYDLMGIEFDNRIVNIVKSGNLDQIFNISDEIISRAGECGLRPIATFAGLASIFKHKTRMLSYEGPFGVGYMVADMTALEY